MRSICIIALSVSLVAILFIPSAAYGWGNGGVPPTAVASPEKANVVFGYKVGGGGSKVSQTITFDGSASYANHNAIITNWDWEFGDGATASGTTVTHAYTMVGSYTVTLTVTDNCFYTGTDTGNVYADEIVWEIIGVGCGGTYHSAAVDPNNAGVVYVGADDGGIVKTTNGGAAWSNLNDNGIISIDKDKAVYGIERIVIDKDNSNTVYLATWGGLLKSTSAGGNWTDLNLPVATYTCGFDIDPQNSNIIYAGLGCFSNESGSGKVYRSTNGGTDWSLITYQSTNCLIDANAGVHTIETDPDTTNHYIYLATTKGFYRSTDNGSTWEQKGTGTLPETYCRDLTISYNSTDSVTTLYLTLKTTVNGTNWDGGVWKSTDRGNTWAEKNDGLPQYTFESSNGYKPTEYRRVAAHPTDPNLVYVSLNASTYNGTDGTFRWGLFKTSNGGNSWTWITPYPNNMEQGWRNEPAIGEPILDIALSADASTIYCPPFLSTDAGANWKQFYADTATTNTPVNWATRGGDIMSLNHVVVDPGNGNNLYLAYTDCGFWRSTNGGTSFFWSTTDADGIGGGNSPRRGGTDYCSGVFQIALDPDSNKSSLVYETAGWKVNTTNVGSFFMSTNSGDDWTEKDEGGNLPEAAIPSFLIFEDTQDTNKRVIYAASYSKGFYRGTFNTSDYSISWAKKGTNSGSELGTTNNQFIRQLVADPNDNSHQTLYGAIQWDPLYYTVTDYGGVFRTIDAGDNWIQIDDDAGSRLPNCRAVAVDPENSNVIYAATWEHTNGTNVFKGGVWRGTYDTQTSNWSWTLKLTDPSGNTTYAETVTIDSDNTAYPADKNLVYASIFETYFGIHSDNPGVYVSPDDGETWFKQSESLKNGVLNIDIDPTDVRRLYLGTFGSGAQRGKFNRWQ